ncbi:MAG: RAMP superfamily CRISPR-associated protein [Succinivibrio sp.]|nr:RAMP superfamily CRISPR-associated protein [Succinivibrio sp.]
MIKARLVFTLDTPLHCGGGDDQFLDQPVSRDSFGLYTIPASSIAGALRAYAKRLDSSENCSVVNKLFGGASATQSKECNSSLLWVSDAKLLDFDGEFAANKFIQGKADNCMIAKMQGPFIRDHVCIDDNSATAKEGGKYDEEIVPSGAKFALELTLDGWDCNVDEECKTLFLALCTSLKNNAISFGGKETNGYGRISFKDDEIMIRQFDLTNEKETEDYLNLKNAPLFSKDDGGKEVSLSSNSNECLNQKMNTVSGDITLTLVSDGPLLIVGPGVGDDLKNIDADMTFVRTPEFDYNLKTLVDKKIVPSTSFKGVLRHRMIDIAKTWGFKDDYSKLLTKIFGDKDDYGVGNLTVTDVPLKGNFNKEIEVQHVAIDRFTGGAYAGALFNEAPVWNKETELDLHIVLNELDFVSAKLLAFALFDLCEGTLPIGNGVNRGNGKLSLKQVNGSYKQSISCNLNIQGKGQITIENGLGDFDKAKEWLLDLDYEDEHEVNTNV